MEFDFNKDKNELLFKNRGVTFNQVIDSIEQDGVLLNFDHPNKDKYPNQRILVVSINQYTYCVPYVTDGDKLFLKTIYPNRNFLYLLEKEEGEHDK